jgi:hypothetical protein
LTAERPPWLGLARRIPPEKRVFEIRLRLPERGDGLLPLSGFVEMHAKVREQLGLPLASSFPAFSSTNEPRQVKARLDRVGQSPLSVEGDDGRAFGALVAIPWPRLGSEAKDVWCRSCVLMLDGQEATRFPRETPLELSYDRKKICVVEQTLDLPKKDCSVDANSRCSGR